MYTWSMMSLQDSNSPNMNLLIFFHDSSLMILILIMSMIFYIIIFIIFNKINNRFILHGQLIEIIWTIVPMIVLIFMVIPSLQILYLNDEIFNPTMTIKTIGHQWYWSYEYPDFFDITFDSFMVNSISLNSFRLLDVDNRTVLPINTPTRLLISSMDVIHSWTIPSLGIKSDATPGRINQTLINLVRPGVFFGQCSEICGANHSFMPIVMEATNVKKFFKWLKLI